MFFPHFMTEANIPMNVPANEVVKCMKSRKEYGNEKGDEKKGIVTVCV